MKRLAIFCFCLLFSVLSALSILNFDGESVAAMEGNMRRMMIVKPEGMSNLYFLRAIDNALNEKNVDIMMRVVSVKKENLFTNIIKLIIPMISLILSQIQIMESSYLIMSP